MDIQFSDLIIFTIAYMESLNAEYAFIQTMKIIKPPL